MPELTKPKQETIEVEGVTYVLQHPGHRAKVRMEDAAQSKDGKFLSENYYGELMRHVIVEPKTSWDYWDQHEGFDDVMAKAITFLRGKKSEE